MKFITTNPFYDKKKNLIEPGTVIQAEGAYAEWLVKANVARPVGGDSDESEADNPSGKRAGKSGRGKGVSAG